jgi:hypothetical protein
MSIKQSAVSIQLSERTEWGWIPDQVGNDNGGHVFPSTLRLLRYVRNDGGRRQLDTGFRRYGDKI